MAERFFFDLTDGLNKIPDEVGVLAADLDEAVEQAQAVLAEMRVNDELADIVGAWMLTIRDAGGDTLVTLPVVPPSSAAATTS